MNLSEIKIKANNEYNIIFTDLKMLLKIDLNILNKIISDPKSSLYEYDKIPYKNKILTLTHLINNHKLRINYYNLLNNNNIDYYLSKLISDYLELKYNVEISKDKYYLKYLKYKQNYLKLKSMK